MARSPTRTWLIRILFFVAISCRIGPSEPSPELGFEESDLEYAACPEGTSPWGQQAVNPLKLWCELWDGGSLSGPYRESWPSATVTGLLGPQAEGPKVKGWYEHGEPVGDWRFWHPDGGLDRIEHHRPRSAAPPQEARQCGCQGLFPLRCSDSMCGVRLGKDREWR